MAEEPTLPQLPPGRGDCFDPCRLRSSKRARLYSSPPISSDPPVFSSDDDPSADNYVARNRSKRRFKGPWYSQKPDESAPLARRTFQRQKDSAVWMGSDGTDADSDADFSSHAPMPPPFTSQKKVVFRPVVKAAQKSPEERAQQHIESCLELGKEDVDLSSQGLTSLANGTIRPLATLVKIPTSSQHEFAHLMPSLKLFLSSNQLRRLPGEIFKLQGLNALSLRNNKLVELPSIVGKTKRLTELTVSNNYLNFLPYEFLELLHAKSRLQTLNIHPNPFYEPFDGKIISAPPSPTGPRIGLSRPPTPPRRSRCKAPNPPREWSQLWDVQYDCRSRVRFIDINGALLAGPELPRHQSLFIAPDSGLNKNKNLQSALDAITIHVAPAGDIPEPPKRSAHGEHISRVKSLLEMAVKTWAESSDQPELRDWLSGEDPEHLSRLLGDARTLREMEAGERKCTVCSRSFVIPRTEWIEWWEISRKPLHDQDMASAASPLRGMENKRDEAERMVPLMRRGCSWKCVPGVVEEYVDSIESS